MDQISQKSRLIPHPLPMNQVFHRENRVPSSAPAPLAGILPSLYKPVPIRNRSCRFGSFFTHNLHMATFYKLPTGWRAQVARHGVRKSRAGFDTKTAAKAWADKVEAEILGGEVVIPNLTVLAVLTRYKEKVSPGKKGAKWELSRIGLLERDRIASVRLKDFGKVDVASWRDRRLEAVSAASVRREWNLLSHACNLAVNEWGWLKSNPFKQVKRPPDGKARKRIATPEEIDLLTAQASPNLRRCIIWALETGMRAGEIASLRPEDLSGNVATLSDTKNGTSREVPLSKIALEQINGERRDNVPQAVGFRQTGIPKAAGEAPDPTLFSLTAGSISGLFAKLCRDQGVKGLTFHDLRRTAIVRLASKLDPMTLAKIVGHRDLRMTLNVYYQADMAEVAKKLDP